MNRHPTLYTARPRLPAGAEAPLGKAIRGLSTSLLLGLVGGCLWSACDKPVESRAVEVIRGAEPIAHNRAMLASWPAPQAIDDRTDQLQQLAKVFAADHQATGQRFDGAVSPGSKQSHLVLLRAGDCYRIFGVGGHGIDDLDLALYDRNEVERTRDLSADRYPQLGGSPSLCPQRSEAYRMEVSAYRGQGAYSVAVWHTLP